MAARRYLLRGTYKRRDGGTVRMTADAGTLAHVSERQTVLTAQRHHRGEPLWSAWLIIDDRQGRELAACSPRGWQAV